MNPLNDQIPLRDIHLPDPVSWWPPAPGWWLLLALVIALLFLLPVLLKRRRNRPLNKLALQELHNIQASYRTQQDKQQLLRELSILLRRTGMSYVSRQQAASITGDAWIEQLNQLSEHRVFTDQLAQWLLNAPYSKHADVDADALLAGCRQWLQGLPRRRPS